MAMKLCSRCGIRCTCKNYTYSTPTQKRNLSNVRVIQKNLVYIIGLSPRIAEEYVIYYIETKVRDLLWPIRHDQEASGEQK